MFLVLLESLVKKDPNSDLRNKDLSKLAFAQTMDCYEKSNLNIKGAGLDFENFAKWYKKCGI